MSLNNRLKQTREAAGLSQKDVAEALNISRQAISRWENGKSYPDLDNLVLLSDLYHISLDELLKGKSSERYNSESNHTLEENESGKNCVLDFDTIVISMIALASCMIPYVGLLITIALIIYSILTNRSKHILFWILLSVCLISNAVNTFTILNDTFFHIGYSSVEMVG